MKNPPAVWLLISFIIGVLVNPFNQDPPNLNDFFDLCSRFASSAFNSSANGDDDISLKNCCLLGLIKAVGSRDLDRASSPVVEAFNGSRASVGVSSSDAFFGVFSSFPSVLSKEITVIVYGWSSRL